MRRSKRAGVCAICCFFAVIIFLCIPSAIFGLSAGFAAILWGVECTDDKIVVKVEAIEAMSGVAQSISLQCSYYDWFLYVTGNLVGLGNPLTQVSPTSGNAFAEIIDLLIAVWSLSVAGTVIGIIGGLAATQVGIDKINALAQRCYAMTRSGSMESKTVSQDIPVDGTEMIDAQLDDTPATAGKSTAAMLSQISADMATVVDAVEKHQRLLNSLNNAMGQLIEEQVSIKAKLKRRRSTRHSVSDDDRGTTMEDE